MSNERKLTESILQALLAAAPAQKEAALAALRGQAPARPAKASEPGALLVGPAKAARILGLSRSTVWRMIRLGRLPLVEVLPGCRVIRRADLDRLAGATP